MTLAKTLLSELSDWKPSGAGRHVLNLPNADGWTTRIEADHSGVVGCLLREISMTRDDATDAPANVQAWATGVADRVSGLLEDLKVIEVDADRGEAVLRSDDPTKNGDTTAAIGPTTYAQYVNSPRPTSFIHPVIETYHDPHTKNSRKFMTMRRCFIFMIMVGLCIAAQYIG